MENKDHKKSKIRQVIDIWFSSEEETQEKNFTDYKTSDDKIIRVEDELTVDAPIVEVTEEGEVALEDGTYKIEDLNLDVVVADGVITEITEEENDEDESEESVVADEEVEEEMSAETEEAKENFEDDTVSAYIELPVGVHTIGDKIYTVETTIENEGTENAYEKNYIVSIVPIDGASDEVVEEETEEEVKDDEKKEEEMSAETEEETTETEEDFTSILKELNSKLEDLGKENKELKEKFEKFSGEPSEESVVTNVSFSEMTKEDKLKFYSRRG